MRMLTKISISENPYSFEFAFGVLIGKSFDNIFEVFFSLEL